MPKPVRRLYLGVRREAGVKHADIFRAAETPTRATHGRSYAMVIGPFRTRRAAEFMRDTSPNPHVQCVADAERIAARLAKGAQ